MTCSDYLGTNLEKMREKVAKKRVSITGKQTIKSFRAG